MNSVHLEFDVPPKLLWASLRLGPIDVDSEVEVLPGVLVHWRIQRNDVLNERLGLHGRLALIDILGQRHKVPKHDHPVQDGCKPAGGGLVSRVLLVRQNDRLAVYIQRPHK